MTTVEARDAQRRDQWLRLRLYEVQCVEIPSKEQQEKGAWAAGRSIGVVCRNAVEAINHVRGKHPTYRIDAVNQRGMVHYVVVADPNSPETVSGEQT